MKNLFKNGTQSRWFCMFIVLALASLILMGCPTPPGPDTDPAKSTNATLSSITVKGKTAGLGTPSAIMDTIVPGTVNILDTDAGTTTGTLADAKATLTKIVKFTASETSTFAAAFASKPPYNNEAVANGDFFVFLVTAEDGNTKLYYRVNVTVQSTQISSDATLSSITINGAAANMGTPNATLGDELAGSIILTNENTGATTGLPVDADATLTKTVKFAAGEFASYVAEFATKDAYKSEAISDGDFFVFLVTAEDGSSLYYRVDVTMSVSLFTLDADNVLNEDNYENVSFFAAPVSEELEDLFTTLDTSITYEMIVAELGSPITDVLAAHEGFKLLAFEFTGPQSGTLLKAGFSEYELAGDATDEMIEVEITAVPAPHEPAEPITASIVGSPITVTATAPNNLHQGGISAYTEFTIQLEHATVASDYFDYNPEWFSPSVVGLYYAITADEGDTQIFVEIGGMPTAASSSQAEITFPASLLLDDNGDYNTDPVAVSGSVIYDIDKAEDATVPDITDITFDSSMFAPFYANDPSTAANKDIGWLYVTGGTGILPTYSFVDDENYPDNEYFTFYYNTLRVKTALTEAKTYSIKIKAEDSGKTYEEVIEIPVAELVPFTGFDFTPPAGKTLVIGSVPSGDEDLYQGTGRYAVIGTIIPEGGKAPITFRKITGEGDTDNDKFTVSSNGSLQVSSTNGLTEVKEYSILVSGQDSSSPRVTIEKVITFDIGYAPAEEPSANVSYERVIEGIVGTSFRGPVQVRIDLTNADAADSLADDEDVTSWFSPAVEGLTYKIDSASYGSIYIEVSGTPTEALSTDDVTITIPADKLLDSNGNSTIEEPLVIETGVSYEILDYVAMIGTTKYLSLQDAVDRLSADTIITILKDIELSAPITIPYRISGGAKVTLKTETDGLTISPSEDFEGNSLFSISLQTDLILGNGSGASHTPTLIIDGKNQVNTLVTVSADNTNGAGVQLYSGVELKNAAQRGIYANSTGNWSASVFINGGAIQSCPIGVEFGYGANPNMGGGIIYGSDGGENANAVSVYNAGSYPFPGNVGILSGLSPTGGPAGDGKYTQTFGTAP